jgi:AraC-like DNA-binding protein
VTHSGVQVFDYRGAVHASLPGQVVVLYADEVHDGRAGGAEGFGYRIVYVDPSRLIEAVRVLRGRPYPLPFVSEPVSANAQLARAIEAFRGPLESLAVDSLESLTGLTRYDIARQFRIMFGTSPHRYLLMRRLEFARERIHRGDPLVAVACEAGFADQAHFSRAFKAAFGLTPGRYRALRKRAA